MNFLLMSPLASKILPFLKSYTRVSADNITLVENDYQIFYAGDIEIDRINDLRMYALVVYDVLRAVVP